MSAVDEEVTSGILARGVPAPTFEGEHVITTTNGSRVASSAFMGGTVFTGGTCSALTAGITALGLALGQIENGRRRVLSMIATMALGGDALADSRNAFDKIMNLGHDLASWFKAEFGSIFCRTLTSCEFSTKEGVRNYLENDRTTQCRAITEAVARRTRALIREREAKHGIARSPSPAFTVAVRGAT